MLEATCALPFDDYYLASEHGPTKAARSARGKMHMGNPAVFEPVFK